MKYLLIIAINILIFNGCSDNSDLNHSGQLDEKCYQDGRCNEGLYCNSEQICKKIQSCTCLNGGTCVDGSSCKCPKGYEGEKCETGYFITTWKSDHGGISKNNEITIPGDAEYIYRYDVDCDSDGVWEKTDIDGDYTCIYNQPGVFQVSIRGTFPHLNFYQDVQTDNAKLLSVDQWGTIQWQSMKGMFYWCTNMTIKAEDRPDLSRVVDMSYMFEGAESFNQPINSWDVSHINQMEGMFYEASSFNQELNNCDISSVTDMSHMFLGASSFNQPLNNWNVSNVIDMSYMFVRANNFNQSLNNWNVDQVTDCNSFSKNLPAWTEPQPNFTGCTP